MECELTSCNRHRPWSTGRAAAQGLEQVIEVSLLFLHRSVLFLSAGGRAHRTLRCRPGKDAGAQSAPPPTTNDPTPQVRHWTIFIGSVICLSIVLSRQFGAQPALDFPPRTRALKGPHGTSWEGGPA